MFERLQQVLRKRAAKNEIASDGERHEAAKNADLKAIIAELKTIIEKLSRANDQASPENTQKRALEQSGVRAVWGAAFVGLLAIIVGGVDSSHQYRIMRKQNDLIAAQDRPWLKPQIDLVDLRFNGNGGAGIDFKIDYVNVGKSVALNIHNSVSAKVLTRNTAINSIPEERAACDEARDEAAFAASGRAPLGIVLFPNEEPPEIIGGKGQVGVGISAASYTNAWPGPNDVAFKIVGCLVYFFGSERGETGYAYLVERDIGGGHAAGFKPGRNQTIPLNQIMFERDAFSSGWVRQTRPNDCPKQKPRAHGASLRTCAERMFISVRFPLPPPPLRGPPPPRFRAGEETSAATPRESFFSHRADGAGQFFGDDGPVAAFVLVGRANPREGAGL